MMGKSYFEYNVGDSQAWQTSAIGHGGTTMAAEQPVRLKASDFLQSVNIGTGSAPDRRVAFHAIQLNSPIIKYCSPAGWPNGVPIWYYNNVALNGWQNINEGANNYQFLSIYETYLKITALPAVNTPDTSETNPPQNTELKANDLTIDSLCLYYMFPNGKDGDAWLLEPTETDDTGLGLIESNLPAPRAADPIRWTYSNAATDMSRSATELNRIKGLRRIPLNTPNTVGGGRTTLTAKWRNKGHLMSNVSDVTEQTVATIPLRYYTQPYDRYTMQLPGQLVNNEWFFYWAIGSDFAPSSARYTYKFKIQMWCKWKAFNYIQNLPNYIGWVRKNQGSLGPSGPTMTQAEKEKEDDDRQLQEVMDIDVPQTPSTPIINQMFQEFARIQEKIGKASHSSSTSTQ